MLDIVVPALEEAMSDDGDSDFEVVDVEPESESPFHASPEPLATSLDARHVRSAGSPPTCSHGDPCKLSISLSQENLYRAFWHCSHTKGCSFTEWAVYQPFWKGHPESSASPCGHRRTSWQGSNGHVKRKKCLDCGTLLVHKIREAATDKGKAASRIHQAKGYDG